MESIRVIRHYHWLAAGWFAVWVIFLSLRIITKSQSLWVRVLSGAFRVNIAWYALPRSFDVALAQSPFDKTRPFAIMIVWKFHPVSFKETRMAREEFPA